jgi:hypothetical protein
VGSIGVVVMCSAGANYGTSRGREFNPPWGLLFTEVIWPVVSVL